MITYRIFSDKNARLSEEHPSSSGWGGRGHCAGGHYHQKRVLFAYKFPGMVCFFIVSCQENIVNRWRRSWFRNKWWGSAGQGGTVSNWCGRILVFINSAVKEKNIIYISVFFWNGSSSWETSWSSPLDLPSSSRTLVQVWELLYSWSSKNSTF